MKNLVLGFSIVLAVLFTGCGLKKDCDFRKNHKSCKNKDTKSENKQTKKVYLGE